MAKKPTYEELEQQYRALREENIAILEAHRKTEESEILHRLTVENISDTVVLTDYHGKMVYVCPNTNLNFGISQSEVYQLSTIDKLMNGVVCDITEVKRENELTNIEWSITDAFGQNRFLLVNVKSVNIKDGTILYVMRDITERKQAEEALRESEEKYRNLIESLQEGIWVLDKDACTTFVNSCMAEMLGYTEDEMLGRHLFEFMDEDGIKISKNNLERRQNGVEEQHEFEFLCKDGSKIYTLIETTPLFDDEKHYSGALASVMNISERRRTEEALRESEEIFRRTFEDSVDGMILGDKNGNFIKVNKALSKILGYSQKELLTMNTFDITYLGDEDPNSDIAQQLFAGESEGFTIEKRYIHKNGDIIWSETTVFPLRDVEGNFKYAVGRLRDITEKKRLEDQLRQSHKMEAIGTLAGGIAHEFNNILGIIIGNTELAIDDVPEWNPAKDCLDEIRSASLRAKDVVRHIMSFSRKSHIERKPLPMSPIIRDTFKLLRPSLPSTIDIRQDLSCEHDTVLADPTQINQVLVNICTNAAHAMREERGVLDVRLEDVLLDEETATQYEDLSPGNHVKLTVKDTGHGIKPENIDRIFDPYFTTKGVGEGTGMGLSVVHGIVKSHDGAINVISELGKGTVVEMLLPITEAEIEPKVVEAKDLPTGNEKILFVDDEKSLVKMNKQKLERLGYQVEAMTNPDEALELFRSNPDAFDLVITDMTMPQMSGDKLALKLMEIRPDIPIIISTGFSEKMDEDKAKEMGIKAVAMKPYEMRTLAVTVRKVLDEK